MKMSDVREGYEPSKPGPKGEVVGTSTTLRNVEPLNVYFRCEKCGYSGIFNVWRGVPRCEGPADGGHPITQMKAEEIIQ